MDDPMKVRGAPPAHLLHLLSLFPPPTASFRSFTRLGASAPCNRERRAEKRGAGRAPQTRPCRPSLERPLGVRLAAPQPHETPEGT